jgi:hypothetical protein
MEYILTLSDILTPLVSILSDQIYHQELPFPLLPLPFPLLPLLSELLPLTYWVLPLL